MAKDMKVKDYVAQMQSGRSFVKAKMDSAGIGKVHLSFVEHSGRPKCEQVAAIEGYLNFEGAGSVSQLYYLVMSRDIRKKYANSVKTARETGSKYPNAIWDSNGGSSEKRDANGNVIKPCRYYAVQVSPGSKSDIVLQVMEGEGEVTETGGYMLKKGATVKRINVPFTFLDFCAFVVDIHDAVAAYKSVHAQLGYVVPSLYIFNKLGTLILIADTQFDFLGITEDASFDDVLKVMDNYGKPYYGHNYTKEREDQAGSGSGILSYLTTDGYKIEFYFDGYGKYMNSVHIAYVPGELSRREGLASLQDNQ